MSQPLPLKDQLKSLEQVQEIDLKIDQLKKSRSELPASLKATDDQLVKIKTSLTTKNNAVSEFDKVRKQTQAALELNTDRLTRSSQRLEGVQNSQEFQAVSKEIEQLKKLKDSLDEQIKKSVTDQETAGKDLETLQVEATKVQSERDAQNSVLSGQIGKLDNQIKELTGERNKIAVNVDPRTLAQYDRVRAQRAGLGIVPAIAGRCKGCNMMVPPQQYNEIHRGNVLHSCPSCHRILFVPTSGAQAPVASVTGG